MASLNGLPVFKITFNEDPQDKGGLNFISLVDYPAIESNWVALKDTKSPMKFTLNEDKQMLYGPILIPDLPIYRYDEATKKEYYVVFSAEIIQKLVRKFQSQQKTINLNYQHQANSTLKEAVIQEIWLTGKVDKSQTLGFDLPENSAFVAAHIGDKTFWDKEIKTGVVKGFSIEAFLDMEMKKQNNTTGQKFDAVKRATSNDLFVSGVIEVGNYVYYGQPQIVLIGEQRQEMRTPVWEDIIELADGRALVLDQGKILQIIEKDQPRNKNKMSVQKFITAKTDKGVEVKSDGEMFTVGAELYTEADGVKTPAPDGDHILENGTTLKVVAGKITEITEEELASEQVAVIQKAVKPLIDQFKTVTDAYEARIKDLETKLAALPGARSRTSNTDPPVTKLSVKKQLETKLSILRKKSAEVA